MKTIIFTKYQVLMRTLLKLGLISDGRNLSCIKEGLYKTVKHNVSLRHDCTHSTKTKPIALWNETNMYGNKVITKVFGTL